MAVGCYPLRNDNGDDSDNTAGVIKAVNLPVDRPGGSAAPADGTRACGGGRGCGRGLAAAEPP